MSKFNSILLTDSYKLSHFDQYPPEMTGMQSYLEARGGDYKNIVFFGLEYYTRLLAMSYITDKDVDQAQFYAIQHGVPFNHKGFKDIVANGGHWPVKIMGKREGSICTVGEPLMTIQSTDNRFPWAVNYLETLLMKVWYPCTVASKAYYVRKILEKWYNKTGADLTGVDFAYHNFGDRGSSSVEAAALGGAAHLTCFKGTDNFHSLALIDRLYDTDSGVGYSIPATEHSTVTSWGKDREFQMIENYLESNKGKPIIACVMDSFNIYKAVEFATTHLKSRIESKEYPTFVIRPDSGNPLDVIPSIFSIMENNKVKYTMVNGFKLFDKYRIIWGDGVDPEAIDGILELVVSLGYSPANMAFGSGGDLMQKINRDTCKFAIKCCAVQYNGTGIWQPVFKEPLHDGFKKSKGGFQEVANGVIYYLNGNVPTQHGFEDIRNEIRNTSR